MEATDGLQSAPAERSKPLAQADTWAHNLGDSTVHLRELLHHHRDRIVSCFVTDVQRSALSPPGVPRSLLVDHIPQFLDEISGELARFEAPRASHDATDTSETARHHGEQRWGLGYDLEALIREYGLLRHCIFQTAKDSGVQVSIDESEIVAKHLTVGIAEAATEYVKYRDEQLNAQKANLEFLAEAGQLLSSSLDYRSTLGHLTRLIVPRLADCCAIHIDGTAALDMPIAHVDPAKADLVREVYHRFPLPTESPYGYPELRRTAQAQLMREVTPQLLETIAADPEHLALLKQINPCSWMVVPLRVQGHLFGALMLMHCGSVRHYTEQDLVLATELANRAATAIDSARLYNLSQQARSRVEAATRTKDEFVAVVSHELRTPLTAILGWIRLLRSGAIDESKKSRAFESIERNAEAQSRLVTDLLDISHTIAGKLRVNPSLVNLGDVIDMALEGTRLAADAKSIHIDLDLDRENAVVRGDAQRLQQVVWNLLLNAVKFTPKNGAVRLMLRRDDSDLEFTVEDNGEGIDPAFLPHVFESFRQSDASAARRHGGLGLGLSIARQIVELHGGSIEARSAGAGCGSTFLVRLPISPPLSADPDLTPVPATKPDSAPAVLPSATARGVRVLIVEDEPDAREVIACMLESCGMEVRLAGSAAEAMRELAQFTPSVILSDIGMPNEDGFFLIRQIRTLPDVQKRGIPAIALTAFASNEDRTRALTEGFNQHMAKPVEPAALVKAVLELTGIPTR